METAKHLFALHRDARLDSAALAALPPEQVQKRVGRIAARLRG